MHDKGLTFKEAVPKSVQALKEPPETSEVAVAARAFQIDVVPSTGALVLKGDLDLSAVKVFEGALRRATEDGGPVILDATELNFMDSTGIRLLIHLAKRLEGRGCVIIHGLNDSVRKVIELTGIDGRLENVHFIPHKRPLSNALTR